MRFDGAPMDHCLAANALRISPPPVRANFGIGSHFSGVEPAHAIAERRRTGGRRAPVGVDAPCPRSP